ncbi:MAG: sugar phosphate nucleotidyltransferase [Anaerolineae bacterium]
MENESLSVVILCGGRGTRMGGTTTSKKELVPIGEQPILWHVMKTYAEYGHTHFILTLGHEAAAIRRFFLEYQPMNYDLTIPLGQTDGVVYHQSNAEENWRVTLADTGLDTDKGSRIYRVAQYIESDRFFVTYGDGVGDIDLDALLSFHRAHGRLATVTAVHPRSQYGVLQTDGSDQVTGFGEKPELDHWINAGFLVFERGVLDYLSEGDDVNLEQETLPRLAAEAELMMYRHAGFWRSMDTFKDAQALDDAWHESAPWKVWD